MKTYELTVGETQKGERVDKFLVEVTGKNRSEVQKRLREGGVTLASGRVLKPNYRVETGEVILFSYEEPEKQELIPQDLTLDILYEDASMVVLNKARGMVIHPGAGNRDGTLVNALLWHVGPAIRAVGDPERPGIVHRLDKDTSGVMVAAKTEDAFRVLQEEIGSHRAQRKYVALVHGNMAGPRGIIRLPLGRSIKDRMKWEVAPKTGRPAVTHFRVLEFLPHYSVLECRLETGRTHQIRVHMSYIGHPVVNDPLYGYKKDHFPIQGQALHSHTLDLHHPVTGEAMHFEAPLPPDMEACIALARKEETL